MDLLHRFRTPTRHVSIVISQTIPIAFSLLLLLRTADGQGLRNFPPLFNAARERPLSTTPAQSTCGVPVQSAFCRSSTFSSSVLDCRQDFCVQECPRRTALPVPAELLVGAGNYGACVTRDQLSVRPGGPVGSFSAFFTPGPACYLTPATVPKLGANGAFTLTFWMWQETGNTGTVLEKWGLTGDVLLRVRVGESVVELHYRTVDGPQVITIPDTLPSRTWTYLALQVYDRTISYFVDDTGLGFSARGTQELAGRLLDANGYVRIGQTNDGADQFQGRLEDMRFYAETLTNREIVEVYNGVLPEVRIQSACRCPPTHPRVRPLHTRYCIRNGVPDNTGDEVLRLANFSHPLAYLNDGDFNSFWVSAFLDDVTIEVNLGDQFQVFYVVLQFYSPQPKVVTIERRRTSTAAWERWQVYADDCQRAFGMPNNGALPNPDSINCIQFATNTEVPYSKGNVTFSVLAPEPVPRPGHNDFYNTPALGEFVLATQVRVRLQDHYYVRHLRHKYYGIYEYVVTGRCNCHGHGETCDLSRRPYVCNCLQESNTVGNQCERCAPLYNDKPFRRGDQLNAYACRPCECYQHADECVYDVSLDSFPDQHERGGGGRCLACRHNTTGARCDTCAPFYFRPEAKSLYAEDVCSPCDCFLPGVEGADVECQKVGGQCTCRLFAGGRRCDQCQPGYFNLQAANPQGCEACGCEPAGTIGGDISCHPQLGQCSCKGDVMGLKCDQCRYGYYNLDIANERGCTACGCDPLGSENRFCNPADGQCQCKANVVGRRCDECAEGTWNFDAGCVPCGCDVDGSEPGTSCNRFTGQCVCKVNTMGLKCEQCKPGFYNLGASAEFGCISCSCDDAGTVEQSNICNNITGACSCKENVQGQQCNICKPATFNLQRDNAMGCEPCDCDITGTDGGATMDPAMLACNQNSGQCACLNNRIGRRCDDCATNYYVSVEPGGGCRPCNCAVGGFIPLTFCNSQTGQCVCYGGESGIAGRACDSCAPGYWNFQRSRRRCERCDCDIAGSLNTTCNTNTGQCSCKTFTTARQCNLCEAGTSNLEADNPFGCSKAPSQQPQPEHVPLSPTALQIFWSPPDYPNGVILTYFLYRDGAQIAALDPGVLMYNDSNLEPFTNYRYSVEATNAFGSAMSPEVTFRTPAGAPTGRVVLTAVNIGSSTASFFWNQPDASNGVIQRYELASTNIYEPGAPPNVHYRGLSLSVTLNDLRPYSVYDFLVRSCTAAGCLESDPVVVETTFALPTGQAPPVVQAISSSSLEVTWSPPTNPNGIIIFYELYIQGVPGLEGGEPDPQRTRIFHPAGEYSDRPASSPPVNVLPPPATSFTVTDLDAYTEYEFQVLCENAVGKAASTWTRSRTLEGEPKEMPTPEVTPESDTSLRLSWPAPTDAQAQGVVTSYNVYHWKAADLAATPFAPPFSWEIIATLGGDALSYVAGGLPPFTNQPFRVELCNSIGCVTSGEVIGQTQIGAPEALNAPTVEALNGTALRLSWSPPAILNGPLPSYIVRRTDSAFNNPPPIVNPGVRFPGHGYYLFPPDTLPQGVGFTGISLWFKTTVRDGLLFFATSEGQDEFVAIQLRSGRPWFLFDPQGCPTSISPELSLDGNAMYNDDKWHHLVARRWATSAQITVDYTITGCTSIVTTTDDEGWSYSDNRWHHLRAVRDAKRGVINIDNEFSGSKDAESCATGNIIGANTGVYIGGRPVDFPSFREERDSRAQIQPPFIGCIRDVMILQQQSPSEEWLDLDWDTAITRQSASAAWEGCPLNLQSGAHFLGTGYIVFEAGLFQGGNQFTLQFDMRTESQNGILLFVHGGPGFFFLVQVVSGGLWFEYSAPDHRDVLIYPSTNVPLCDGRWRSVSFLKQGRYMEASVTGGPDAQLGAPNIPLILFLVSAIHIGGIKPGSGADTFIKENNIQTTQGSFGGCIRNMRLQRRPYDFTSTRTRESLNVKLDGCPADAATLRPCQELLTSIVYNGSDTSIIDDDLLPFTDYIYQVEAYNEAGSAFGAWNSGRTREAPPFSVAGPLSASVVDGYTIQAEWEVPVVRTGLLRELQLLAYDRDDPTLAPVTAIFANLTWTAGAITDAVPNTNYTVRLAACTWGGCTVSADGINVVTPEEPPENMSAPVILESSSSWLVVGWSPPGQPNGPITGYSLYRDGAEIYGGSEENFNVTGLLVYTAYEFYVRGCTRVGCTDSPRVALSTEQLPPTLVLPPVLTIKGTRRIQVNWDTPEQTNGVLERYLIYVSVGTVANPTQLLYNNSALFLEHILDDLIPGTTYHISVGACTGGGCTISDPSTATTLESAPEGVQAPNYTSPSPSQLNVSWEIPEYPNGIITEYKLFHNKLVVFSNSNPRWVLIDGLQPWSLHTLSIQACTLRGCSDSDEIQARTQEAPPRGIIGLVIRVLGPRSISALWNAPSEPHGDIFYDVFFEGSFYNNPANWDYSLVSDRRSLYRGQVSGSEVVIEKLIPMSIYQVQVNASNTKGFLLSVVRRAEMPMGTPDGLRPPELTSEEPTSVRVVWQPAGRSNADQEPVYQLHFRRKDQAPGYEDLFSSPTTSQSFLKQGLQPFTEYEFRLVAMNQIGQTRTEWISITTRQDKPESIDPPLVNNVRARTALLQWEPPLVPNGIITQYRIHQNSSFRVATPGNVTYIELEDLAPYTFYMFQVQACTVPGCTISAPSRVIQTLGSIPEGMGAPILISPTPTSVDILWSPPTAPNGVILSYRLERRLDAPGAPSVIVATFLDTDQRRYEDRTADIRPYTTYEYRVVAVNRAGEARSPWASVTTKAARPGGVQAPVVEVLSATSVLVSWEPPIQLNGQLESYVVRLPIPRVEVFNVSQTSLLLENLQPFTQYQVTIIACTNGGCTESVPTVVSTNPAVPSGIQIPVGTPVSQTYVSVIWQPPTQPNGANLRYELSRLKVRQPLEPSIIDLGYWESVYTGEETYFDDRSLSIYTTYRYRVTVYNDYGQVTSGPSEEVTTFGGTPTEPAVVTASTVNHTSVRVEWITPGVAALQGDVTEVQVSLRAGGSTNSLVAAANSTSVTVTELEPNTQYEIHVTLVVHGGGSITSDPVYVQTRDGAPEGLLPPQLIVVNRTAVRVVWLPPERPNGRVIAYNVYVDDEKLETGLTTGGSYLVGELRPYVIYRFKLEVCTIYDCLQSSEVLGTTAESVPYGLSRPSLYVQSATSIRVTWAAPAQPQGIILRYDLLRRDYIPCQQKVPVTEEPPSGKCQYYECGISESFCGSECYSGPKTCCSGVLHDNKVGYECCGEHYVPRRLQFDDVCCGGKFYRPLANHQCCANRYVEVRSGQICCPDPEQARVSVGVGDSCCAGFPFSSTGSQICCNGKLHDKYDKQCCGGEMVEDGLTCCGNSTIGSAHESVDGHVCCGDQYIPRDTTICCTNDIGLAKSHSFGSPEELALANTKCCGTELVSAGLRCCNGVGYSSFSQVCADRSDVVNGCGSGVVCAVSQSATAFCNRCDFDRATTKCGATAPRAVVMETPPPQEGLCWTDPVRIYRGLEFAYLDEGLRPYTEYEYSVVAVNGAGSRDSPYNSAITAQAQPAGLAPPTARVVANQLDTIYLTWEPPDEQNGEIIQYVLMRDAVEIYRDPLRREYRDDNAIQPYQTYTYRLRACNAAGCINSPPVSVATLQAMPELVSPPSVSPVSSTSLYITWTPPGRPNGIITNYNLVSLTKGTTITLSGDTSSYLVTGLEKYGLYQFLLTVCSEAGCTNSSVVSARTSQDKPEGLSAARLVTVNTTTVEIYWDPPTSPNGVVSAYRVYRGSLAGPMDLVFTGPGDVYMTVDASLTPGNAYLYVLEAVTGRGRTNSSSATVTMPTLSPEGIQAPTSATALGPNEILVRWNMPVLRNFIDQFRVVLNAGGTDEIERGVGLVDEALIEGLRPYKLYSVRIKACIRGVDNGCGIGPAVSVRTLEASPVGQPPPRLKATGPSVIELEWDPPAEPNGVIIQYQVHRKKEGVAGQGLLINVLPGTSRGFTNAGTELLPFTVYLYRVTAVNSQNQVTSDWAQERTLEAVPQDVSPPSVVSSDAYSIAVSWQPPRRPNGRVVSYRLDYRRLSSDPTFNYPTDAVTVGADVRQTSISGLMPYTTYQIRVVARNGAGETYSMWANVPTGQGSPANVGPFTIEKIATGLSVILRWSPPAQPNGVITNYLIYEEGNVNPIFQGLSREFEYRRLRPYTRYSVQLEACTVGGCGRSTAQSFRTAEIAPTDQPTPTVGFVNATLITIQWTRPVNPNGQILKYQLLRRVEQRIRKRQLSEPVAVFETEDTDASEYTYVDNDVQPFTRYVYVVRSVNSKGVTESSPQTIETDQAAPEGLNPPILSQVANRHDQLRIQWNAPTRTNGILQGYSLQRNNSVPWSFAPGAAKEFIDEGLTAYTLYSYRVTACTAGGCTDSLPALIRTQETAPFFVGPPSLTTISNTAVRATWQPPQITNGRIRDYRLSVNNQTRYTGQDLEYTARGLTPSMPYEFVLTACTFGGCTSSSAVVARPLEAPPSGMAAPTLRVTSSSSVEITWRPPAYPNGVITSYEVRRDGALIDTTGGLDYIDYEVMPGREYSYRVTAYNSQGSTESPAAVATTYSSTPSGLAAPTIRALSSTSVLAVWESPVNPNGRIHNYTLYKDNDIVYSEQGLQATVMGLDHWTEYAFRVVACTSNGCTTSEPTRARTLEAPPIGMGRPRLTPSADGRGKHNGVLVEWEAPRRPNGVIIRYEVYRRNYTGLSSALTGGPRKLIYSGLELKHNDQDSSLRPFTRYEYMVAAHNSEGFTSSEWQDVMTREAPPVGLPAPKVLSVTTNSIRIEIQEPARLNGYLNHYIVYLNDRQVLQTRSSLVDLFEVDGRPLQPYTDYLVSVAACTGGGCARSEAVQTRTLPRVPAGQQPPTFDNVTATSMDVTWTPPEQPNGRILRYDLDMRRGCPHPYADDGDALVLPCEPSNWQSKARGLLYSIHLEDLLPYTTYEFRLNATNEAGGLASPPTGRQHTQPTAPVYRKNPVRWTLAGNEIIVTWADSFYINGELRHFVLEVDGQETYRGARTQTNVFRENRYKTFTFKARIVTAEGEAQTPTTTFDPYQQDRPFTPPTTELAEAGRQAAGVPIYQEVWFIALVSILALILLFVGLACCLRSSGRRLPYIRERMPLQNKELKGQPAPYCIDPYNGSIISTTLPNGTLHTDTAEAPPVNNRSRSAPNTPHLAHRPYFTNPTYAHLSLPRPVHRLHAKGGGGGVGGAGTLSRRSVSMGSLRHGASTPLYSRRPSVATASSHHGSMATLSLPGSMANVNASPDPDTSRPSSMADLAELSLQLEIQPPTSHLPAQGVVGHPGYVNPAYSHLSIASRTGSIADLNLDKISHKSSRWDEEEEDDEKQWDAPAPQDSGLHSLAYGEDYDATSERAVSVLKEHTMFTDTHL